MSTELKNDLEAKYKQHFDETCPTKPYLNFIYKSVKRIVVIGDIHGDYIMMIEALKLGKLIDNNNNWIGGNTYVVQVGDQIDRCRPLPGMTCDNPKATTDDEGSDGKILKFLSNLNIEARKTGGAIINLLGNHEIMNSMGNMNYVSYMGIKEFGTMENRINAFKPGNEYAKLLACERTSIVIIGDFLFVHAAILPILMQKYNNKGLSALMDVNMSIRNWLLDKIDKESIMELLVSKDISPFWPRIFGEIKPNVKDTDIDCQKYVNPVIDTLQIGGIVVGHTPQYYTHKEGINGTCSNKLFRADIGSSKAFQKYDNKYHLGKKNRRVQILEILNNKDFNVLTN